jgi:hypothetical protein
MMQIEEKMAESRWTVPAVSVVIVTMLVAFYAVVSAAAEAGERRRQVSASQASELKRCRALTSWDASWDCLKQLDAPTATEEPILLASK